MPDPEFNEYRDTLLERLQRSPEVADDAARARAKTAFTTSIRSEWMFWNQVWTQQEGSV